MHKKIIFFSLFILTFFSYILDIKAAGSDEIFLYIGQDKPTQWNSWTREKRHEYLQSLGLYPARGDNYEGKVKDLDTYFMLMGKTEPENWNSMTFTEKKAYLSKSKNKSKEDNNKSQIHMDNLNKSFTQKEENKKIPYEFFLVFGISLGLLLIVITYKTD